MKPIYLDYAAATPVDPEVFNAMLSYFSDVFYNPSALYSGGLKARDALVAARSEVAQTIGCRPSEIIFTAGGSESTNLAIHGIAKQFDDAEIIISAVEHEAVRKPAQHYSTKVWPVSEKGIVEAAQLPVLITDKTVLISVMYANNEVGSVQPIREIAEQINVIRESRKEAGNTRPLYFHVDAAQAPLYLDVNVARLKVDLLTLNGGKMYGPKQSGILYVKSGIRVTPLIDGGGQEFGIRSGTENVAFAVGFATALTKAQAAHKENSRTVGEFSRYFISQLQEQFGANLNGHKKQRLPNNIHVTFKGHDNERMLFSLDDQGIFAATGSACSASSDEVSHVLSAMGISEEDARASLRFSLGLETTREDIDATLTALQKAVKA